MANLVKCSDCGKKVSINAQSCPKCGAILTEQVGFQDKKEKMIQKMDKEQKTLENNKKLLSWLVAAIVLFFAFGVMLSSFIFGLIMFVGAILIISPVKDFFIRKYSVSRRMLSWISFLLIAVGFIVGGIEAENQNKEETLESNEKVADASSNKDTEVSQALKIDDKSQPEIIAEDYSQIVIPYTEKSYPKLYAEWGDDWIEEINAMLPEVVAKVATESKCDIPEIVDISEMRSTPKKEAVFFVDCRNQERFYISQNELSDTKQVKAESDVLSGEPSQYIRPCEDMIKAQLSYPSTLRSNMGTNAFKGTSGNMVVEISFTTKNALGAELPQAARCVFSTDGKNEAVITNR